MRAGRGETEGLDGGTARTFGVLRGACRQGKLKNGAKMVMGFAAASPPQGCGSHLPSMVANIWGDTGLAR
jgi:hypothetical protein